MRQCCAGGMGARAHTHNLRSNHDSRERKARSAAGSAAGSLPGRRMLYTKISVDFLFGRVPAVDQVRAALDEVQNARAALAALDGGQ